MSNKISLFSKQTLMPWLIILGGLLLAFSKPIYSKLSPADLDIQIKEASVIMPSVYKVYANEEALEGKYSLFRMVLTNNGSNTAENVEVFYEIPGYIESKLCKKISKIMPGQSVVVNCYPDFKDNVVEKTTGSKETVNIVVKGPNIKTKENSFDVPMKGRNEFVYSFMPSDEIRTGYDMFDNKFLLSCLVTPEDPIIKYYTQKIQEKILKGEKAAVGGGEREGIRFLLGIYEAMLRSHTVYSGTSGVPETLGSSNTMTQSIRLPREVITGRTGLCIELSLVYASILMNAGLDPIIYLVPGHAYPGFRMNGSVYAIESTGIGGEGMNSIATGEQALQSGMKSLKEFEQAAMNGDTRYMYLDVREAIKNGALAMELKDDNYLRQKIDEIAQTFDGSAGISTNTNVGGGVQVSNNGNDNGSGGNGGNGGNTGGGDNVSDGSGGGNPSGNNVPAGYKSYSGVVNFAYPASWKKVPRSQYTLQNNMATYGNSKSTMSVEVYNFPGYNAAENAMQTLQQEINSLSQYVAGWGMRYQQAGQAGGYSIFKGVTGNQNIVYNWIAALKPTSNGISGIAVGASAGVDLNSVATKIFNTLQ